MRQALEALQEPYLGYAKDFERPFSVNNHEALSPTDLHWSHWVNGQIASYEDDSTRAITMQRCCGHALSSKPGLPTALVFPPKLTARQQEFYAREEYRQFSQVRPGRV